MAIDSDTEAWNTYAQKTPMSSEFYYQEREINEKPAFLAGRQSVFDDHPAVLRAAAKLLNEHGIQWHGPTGRACVFLADRLEAGK